MNLEKTDGCEKPEVSFEAAIARLDEVVGRLERGDVPLDDALGLFEEGTGLLKRLHRLLDNAEQKVKALTQAETPVVTPFVGEE